MHNQVTISSLKNTCRYFGTYTDAGHFNTELNQVSRHQLLAAIDTEVERQLDSLIGGKGVIRVKNLKLKLTLSRRDFSLNGLAGLLASQLVAALAEQLLSNSDNVRIYASETDYLVELICDLLAGRAWLTWEYQELEALRQLDATEAVVQLLLPRLEMLTDMVPLLRQRQRLQLLLNSLNREQSMRLFRQWTGHEPALLFDDSVLPDPKQLQIQLAIFEPAAARQEPAGEAFEVRILREFFGALAVGQKLDVQSALWVIAHYCFLRLNPELLDLVQQQKVGADPAIVTSKQSAAAVADHAEQFHLWLRKGRDRQDYLDKLLTRARTGRDRGADGKPASLNLPSDLSGRDGSRIIHSDYAGLVLLFPVFIGLELHRCFAPARLREAMEIALFGEVEHESLPWLQDLLPDNEQSPGNELPVNWQLGLDAESKRKVEQLDGTDQLAQLLLTQFAARLGGLQQSSAEYLRRQFLRHPGSIAISKDMVEIILEPVPLNIVLQMAGLSDWLGRMAWLGLELKIGIKT